MGVGQRAVSKCCHTRTAIHPAHGVVPHVRHIHAVGAINGEQHRIIEAGSLAEAIGESLLRRLAGHGGHHACGGDLPQRAIAAVSHEHDAHAGHRNAHRLTEPRNGTCAVHPPGGTRRSRQRRHLGRCQLNAADHVVARVTYVQDASHTINAHPLWRAERSQRACRIGDPGNARLARERGNRAVRRDFADGMIACISHVNAAAVIRHHTRGQVESGQGGAVGTAGLPGKSRPGGDFPGPWNNLADGVVVSVSNQQAAGTIQHGSAWKPEFRRGSRALRRSSRRMPRHRGEGIGLCLQACGDKQHKD